MTRDELLEEAERVTTALRLRYGAKLPEDVRTTLSYFASCKTGLDRAAQHVVNLRALTKDSS